MLPSVVLTVIHTENTQLDWILRFHLIHGSQVEMKKFILIQSNLVIFFVLIFVLY